MIAVIFIPVKCYNIIYGTANLDDEEFQKRFKTFIMDLKTTDPLCFQFITVFFFRRAVYASVFVILGYYPLVQVVAATGCVVFMLLYLVIVRPYMSFLSTFLSILNEVMLGGMILTTFRFTNPEISPILSSQLGLFLVGLIASTIAINWVAIIAFGVAQFVKKRMHKRSTKRLKLSQENVEELDWPRNTDNTSISKTAKKKEIV